MEECESQRVAGEGKVVDRHRYYALNNATKKAQQWEYVECDGHLMTHLDGVLLGLLEAPKTWHLLECKTSNKKNFEHLLKNGCQKSQPKHWAQCQMGMGLAGLTRCVYVVQCKDDDRLYFERIKFDRKEYETLLRKANAIIKADSPPDRIGKDPSFYLCKFCDYSSFCFGMEFPDISCRTCAHGTPASGGIWSCARDFVCSNDCQEHIFLPSLIHWAEPTDGAPTWVAYKADGYEFINCAASGFPASELEHYSSRELREGK